ncbi:glycosyl hydrolase [Nocardioides mangrovi]|uniref:Glycoside hydrolase family 26 protein n=1 Tax=Nocardioides mangrovi TaxID=2874580 RepID=A0ABS7UIS9_9ACTN|nr:glycosyl hydrolase [Nocardioides mangrovi]MBZ5740744.1 glycoside hydrolase family 26 protein [Nocardioides mangrovi]
MSGATPALARPQTAAVRAASVAVRLAPPLVMTGEPASLVATTAPAAAGRTVTVQRLLDGTWTTVATATTAADGQVTAALDTSIAGSQTLRAVTGAVTSGTTMLTVSDGTTCLPRTAPVDPEATPATVCLAARLDRWRKAGLMGVGQQLNMSNDQFSSPLTALGDRRVSVVGFDLMELDKSKHYDFPFFDQGFASLVSLAQSGAVLTASWHAPNPHTGATDSYGDRSWHSLGALLRDTPEAATFWAAYDEQLAVLADFQAAGVPVIFRPLHEANGDWFWWGRPKAATYKKLWAAMQQRAWASGVHNLLWSYGFAADTRKGISDPTTLMPGAVDVAGIDSYYPATGAHRGGSSAPPMSGYAAVAKLAPRMAFTEVGPAADSDGSWSPAVISTVAKAQKRRPAWSMLWVDDGSGLKQIASLSGGLSWLDTCTNGFCRLS